MGFKNFNDLFNYHQFILTVVLVKIKYSLSSQYVKNQRLPNL